MSCLYLYEIVFAENDSQIHYFHSELCGLLTKREVKMVGHWPSSFFVCLGTKSKLSSKSTQRGQYPAILTEQTCSIKDLCMATAAALRENRGQSRLRRQDRPI